MTISADEVMPLLLEACPSFHETWEKEVKEDYVNRNEDGTRLHYLDASDFARHVVQLAKAKDMDELPAVFDVLERLHVEGDEYVQELATVGYFEDLQDNEGHDDSVFIPYLGPESRRWWFGVKAYCRGEIPRIQPVDI